MGPALVLIGCAILAGLALLRIIAKPTDWLQALGLLLGSLAYTSFGVLFILIGGQHILGERAWLTQWIRSSLWHLASMAVGIAVAIVVTLVVIWW